MTTTSERPATRPSTRPAGAPDADAPLRAAVPAALWALGAGFVCVGLPVLLVWAADSRSSSDAVAALRAAGQVWLVAHGVPLGLGAGRLSLTPLGLVLLPLGLLLRAGGSAARQHPVATLREAGLLTAAVAGPYALVAALVAVLSASAAVRPSVLGAVVGASVVALLGAGAGVLRASGLDSDLAGRVPLLLRRLLAPAGAAVLVVLGAGALLAGVRLALEAGRAAELARASAPGAVGGVALLLLGVALVPNAAVWGAAWWVGPGFAVGAGTSVGPFAHELGAVPALPLLAALPSSGLPRGAGAAALLVPLVAGLVAGRLLARTAAPGTRPVREAVLCGPVAGVLLALAALVSAGSAGAHRLTDLGAAWWQVGPALAAEVAVGAVVSCWWATRRG